MGAKKKNKSGLSVKLVSAGSGIIKKVRALRINKRDIYIVTVAVALIVLLYFFKGIFVAAVVNGKPVTRISVVRALEKQGGKQALENLITKKLVVIEAQKSGVNVSKDDINQKIAQIEEQLKTQEQDLESVLLMQGMTRSDLEEEIGLRVALERLLGDKIKPSDEEVKKYMADNSMEDEAKAREELQNQKFSEEVQTFLSDLKQKASINYWVTY